MHDVNAPARRSIPVLWSYAFRPFFLSTAAYAVILMAGWFGVLHAAWPVAGSQPAAWHAHEMLFGVVAAAVAGFLLTAIANWTGSAPVSGRALILLWLAWLAGRLAFWLGDPLASGLPGQLLTVLDLTFLIALTLIAGRILIATGNRRNFIMIAVLAALLLANILWHSVPVTMAGSRLAIDVMLLLMVIIGGRIIPSFTRNWLLQNGRQANTIGAPPRLDQAAIAGVALLPAGDLAMVPAPVTAGVALLAAALNAWRLAMWGGWRTRRNPLLWILHLGYAWIVAALAFRGLGHWSPAIAATAWLHAAGAGAMGTLIIGVMSRVALGHTGRPLVLPRTGPVMYLAITLAALFRTGHAAGWLTGMWPVCLAGGLWIMAFGWFLALYGAILFRPRVDGRPG